MQPLSRRTLLGTAIGSAALVAAGTAIGVKPASAHEPMDDHNEINGQYTYLFDRNTNGMGTSPHTFEYNRTFYTRLETWHQFYWGLTPSTWANPTRLAISAIHRDTKIEGTNIWSQHVWGKAMDIERIYMTDLNTHAQIYAANLRGYQLAGLAETHREWQKYWAAVASLEYHFDSVLHYYYTGHQDHVHADMEISGASNSRFKTGSSVQVKFVQASLNSIWGTTPRLVIDGVYGAKTSAAGKAALARMNLSGYLTSSQSNWLAYCRGSVIMGSGRGTF
jgi:hypothetical protein